jgi:hypothetical protein
MSPFAIRAVWHLAPRFTLLHGPRVVEYRGPAANDAFYGA